jgi:hypothetical protein
MKLTVTSWGTEMGRIAVPGHPRQKSFKTSFSVDKKKLDVVHTHVILEMKGSLK